MEIVAGSFSLFQVWCGVVWCGARVKVVVVPLSAKQSRAIINLKKKMLLSQQLFPSLSFPSERPSPPPSAGISSGAFLRMSPESNRHLLPVVPSSLKVRLSMLPNYYHLENSIICISYYH